MSPSFSLGSTSHPYSPCLFPAGLNRLVAIEWGASFSRHTFANRPSRSIRRRCTVVDHVAGGDRWPRLRHPEILRMRNLHMDAEEDCEERRCDYSHDTPPRL